jgi:hypothetical protein
MGSEILTIGALLFLPLGALGLLSSIGVYKQSTLLERKVALDWLAERIK